MSTKSLRITNAVTIATVAIILALFALATPASASDGATLFKAKCAACHGADGSKAKFGTSQVRPLNSADVQGQTDDQLVAIVSKGKAKMPAFAAKLSADEIKAIVAHVRTLKK